MASVIPSFRYNDDTVIIEEPLTIIVGGGLGGLLTATILHARKIPFLILEKTDQLGGRLRVGNHFVHRNIISMERYLQATVSILMTTKERRKGEWVDIGMNVDPQESRILDPTFFSKCIETFETSTSLEKEVSSVNTDKKFIILKDGTELNFKELYWCARLRNLLKIATKPPAALPSKQIKSLESPAQIHIEFELSEPLFPVEYRLFLPFRLREMKFSLVGSHANTKDGKFLFHLFFPIEGQAAEDPEEIAKIVRAAKRELQKEFPLLSKVTLSERIVFMDDCPASQAITTPSLEIYPSVFYVGPELRTREDSSSREDDLILENCSLIDARLSS